MPYSDRLLEAAFANNHRPFSCANEVTMRRVKAWHLCLHFGATSFTLGQLLTSAIGVSFAHGVSTWKLVITHLVPLQS